MTQRKVTPPTTNLYKHELYKIFFFHEKKKMSIVNLINSPNLPPEILTEIFKYLKDDYKSLYPCTLVNRHWHNISIPIIWRDPFYSTISFQILVNCLLVEDEDFLTKNDIKLTFELLKKPLYTIMRD